MHWIIRSALRAAALLTSMAVVAAAGPVAGANAAKLGPAPVPCAPAPCGQAGQPMLPANEMAESTKVHLTISPHVVRPGTLVTMKVTYSGDGHCLVEQGSTCGPQGAVNVSMVRVGCNPPHTQIPVPTFAQADATTQCFRATDSTAVGAPFYALISAPIGQCGLTNGVFDCISTDYLQIEPPCNGSSTGAGRDAADTSRDCPLDVTAAPQKRSITSGLAKPDRDGPAFIGGSHDSCLNGCTTILVTVKDPATHKVVKGARVHASVKPINGGVPYPKGVRATGGFLCNDAAPTDCGAKGFHDIRLKTNRHGQVKLIYWGPAVLRKQSTTLTVKATKPCSRTACSTGEKSGEATPNPILTILPNEVYDHGGPLTLEQATDLAAWTERGTLGRAILTHGAIEALKTGIEYLIKDEHLAEFAGEATGGVLTIVHMSLEEREKLGLMGIFMKAFHLHEAGLGYGARSGLVQAQPAQKFVDAFAGEGGLLSAGGTLWKLGQRLALYRSANELREQDLQVRVFEVSYCIQGELCGPGYRNLNSRLAGIQPFLYFFVSATQNSPIHGFTGAFVVPYAAHAWMRAQFGR